MDQHPLAKSLCRFGIPREVADTIETETAGIRRFRIGRITLLDRWLDCGAHVFRVDDLVWIYKLVVRVNGSPVYYVKLHDRHGYQTSMAMKERHVDATLTALFTLSPWVFAGFDPQLDNAWKTNRARLIDAVDQRRQEKHLGKTPSDQ